MTDEHKQPMQEQQADAALELLMNEYAEIEGEALWREFQAAQAAGNGPDSDREDRKRSRGSKRHNRRKNFLGCLEKGIKRVAAIVLVLLVLLSPAVMSVEAFKLPVLNYIVALGSTFSGLSFGKNEHLSEEQAEIVDLIKSWPCPDGYILTDIKTTADGKMWLYYEYDGEVALKISIYPSEGQFNIDTEDVEQIPMEIHDYEAVYLQKEGHRLMWMDARRELVFDVRAFELEKEHFWKYTYGLVEILSQ